MTGAFPWLLLAQGVDDLVEQIRPSKSVLIQNLIIAGSLLVVIGLATVWLVLFRKKRRRHLHHWNRHDASTAEGSASPAESEDRQERGRKHRRPRNPTLAETRGLPPVRDKPSTGAPPY